MTHSFFDLENILSTASELKYTKAIKNILSKEFGSPTEEFVRFFGSQVYSGRMTQSAMERFTVIVKEALNQFIRERISERLKTALDDVKEEEVEEEQESEEVDSEELTEREIEGFNIIKAITREVVKVERIFLRNTKQYCGVHLDDHRRKVICRLKFKKATNYIEIFVDGSCSKIKLGNLNDIFNYSEQIKNAVLQIIAEKKEV